MRHELLVFTTMMMSSSALAAPGSSQRIAGLDGHAPYQRYAFQAEAGRFLSGEYGVSVSAMPHRNLAVRGALGYRARNASIVEDSAWSYGVALNPRDGLTLDLAIAALPFHSGLDGFACSFGVGVVLSRTLAFRMQAALEWSTAFGDVLLSVGLGAQLNHDPQFNEFSVMLLPRIAIGYSFLD